MIHKLTLTVLPERYAICRLPAHAPLPAWTGIDSPTQLVSITRTEEELSIICLDASVPAVQVAGADLRTEKGWRCLKVVGPLDFAMTGVIAALSGALAAVGITVIALGTYDTDYLLVRQESLERAIRALRVDGHTIQES